MLVCLMTLFASGCGGRASGGSGYKNIRYTDKDTTVISGTLARDITDHNDQCKADPACEKRPRTK